MFSFDAISIHFAVSIVDFGTDSKFILNSSPVAANKYVVCLQLFVVCEVKAMRRLSTIKTCAGLLVLRKRLTFTELRICY